MGSGSASANHFLTQLSTFSLSVTQRGLMFSTTTFFFDSNEGTFRPSLFLHGNIWVIEGEKGMAE